MHMVQRIKTQNEKPELVVVMALMRIHCPERPPSVAEIESPNFGIKNTPLIGPLLGFCLGLNTVNKEAPTR